MPLDAIVLSALRNELKPILEGSRIDRINMPERDMILLSVYTREGNKKLLISCRSGAARVHLTAQSFENPAQPPMFCMLLRKHLLGARITSVEQPGRERILLLRMDAVDELNAHSGKLLSVELMGKALNVVLVGEDGRILDCLHRVDCETGRRPLLPGLFFALPPVQERPGFYDTEPGTFSALLSGAERTVPPEKWLQSTFGGLSPLLCRELALHGWDALPERAAALKRLADEQRYIPTMLLEQGKPKDFSFLPIHQYGDRMELVTGESFSAMLDEFYARRDREENLRRRGSELFRLARTSRDRQLRKLAAREQELLATEDREEYRRRGDLITANMYRLQKGMGSFETTDYYDPDGPTVTVPLDRLKTPQQNAALNYKLYNKAKTAHKMLTELIRTGREELAYLESVMDELERAENEKDLGEIRAELAAAGYIREKAGNKKKKLPPRKPLRFVTDSGHEIRVGRSNVQNDELTFRTARRTDLWFHVQKLPGSHVILSQSDGEADETAIREAAMLAVTYSRAGKGGRTAVDYTHVRFVKKPSGARPGQVIFTDYKTVLAEADPVSAEKWMQKE